MRSFFNCKTAAIMANDPECIYLFKTLLSCSATQLASLSGPIVWGGLCLPKNGHKGRDANNSLQWGGMPKMRKGS